MEIVIDIILCVMLTLGIAGFVLSISNEKEIKRIYNTLHSYKRDMLIIRDDVSKLKIEHEKDNLTVYNAIEIFKVIENYVWLSEQERAALKLGIDELSRLYNQKGESGETNNDE